MLKRIKRICLIINDMVLILVDNSGCHILVAAISK